MLSQCVRCIDHYGATGSQLLRRAAAQFGVGAVAHLAAVETGAELGGRRLPRVEARKLLAVRVGGKVGGADAAGEAPGEHRLAGAREPADENQRGRRTPCRQRGREPEVARRRCAEALPLRRRYLLGACADRLHFPAHEGALTAVQRLQHPERLIAGACDVAAGQFVAERRVPLGLEVHREEAEVVADVDVAEAVLLAELDAVDRDHPCRVARDTVRWHQVDVLRLQVAVALDDAAGRRALVEERCLAAQH